MELNWVLIVTLIIIVFFAIKGWRQGIIGIVFGLVAWVFMIGAMFIVSPQVETSLASNANIYNSIYSKVETYITEKAAQDTSGNLNEWYDSLTQGLPSSESGDLAESLQEFNGSGIDLSALLNDSGVSTDSMGGTSAILSYGNGQTTILQMISSKISLFIIHCMAVVLTFIVAEIIVFVVGFLVRKIGRMPVVKPTNLLLGVLVGAAEGLLVVWILFYFVACISATAWGQSILANVYANPFLSTLYDNNLIMTLIK